MTDLTDPEVLPPEPVVTRAYGLLLVLLGIPGLAAAFSLAVDKYKILEDPSFQPSCNFNPVLSCGSVMVKEQAEAFGFPNPLIGLVAFSVVIAVGVLITARVTLPTWVFGGLALGSALGAAFVHWLAFQSIYRIGALCPWCMVVWTVVLPVALWSLLVFARQVPAVRRPADALWSVRFLLLLFWYLTFVTAILVEFWDYWSTLI